MDQTKIGKLIAKLRKEKGMTQRELGDKVGVGFKAVSKWERGITCPDISIINELSKILGITSDELLTGELNKEHQIKHSSNKKINKKIFIIISILLLTIFIIFIILKINNNHIDVYNLNSINNEYYVEGKVIFNKSIIEIYINQIRFIDKEFNKKIVNNYSYKIDYGNNNIVNFGYFINSNEIMFPMSIRDLVKTINISYSKELDLNKKQIIENGLLLQISFLDYENNVIEKNIELSLNKK